MSHTPTTLNGESGVPSGYGWNDAAELHKCSDGGGVFHRFKTIRRGTVAELVKFVMDLPEDMQADYAIQKGGDHRLSIGEIRALSRRADFPRGDRD
jgi:hypothetical protein